MEHHSLPPVHAVNQHSGPTSQQALHRRLRVTPADASTNRADRSGTCPICGMALEPRDVFAEVEADPEYDSMRLRFWVSAALSLPLLLLSMPGDHWFACRTNCEKWNRIPSRYARSESGGGLAFFQRFWESACQSQPNMFTLIGLGTAAYLDMWAQRSSRNFPASFATCTARFRSISKPQP